MIPALAALMAPVVAVSATPTSLAFSRSNAYATELSLNGIWALTHAFFNNEIDYRRFHKTLPQQAVAKRIKTLLEEKDGLLASPGPDPLTRLIRREGRMLRKNVMLVSMESMGAEYLAHFGNRQNLTPRSRSPCQRGPAVHQAAGDRHAHGARPRSLDLSVPPTPGQSILRRPHNAELFSIGDVFATAVTTRDFSMAATATSTT